MPRCRGPISEFFRGYRPDLPQDRTNDGYVMRALTAVISIFLFFPPTAGACTFSASTYFREVARSFSVAVQFEGKPLAAANVTIFSFDTIQPVSSASTAHD